MKKLISLVALAAAFMVGGVASAASVNILMNQTAVGGPFSLSVDDGGNQVAQIAILILGSTSGNTFTVAANGGANNINISANTPTGDSVFAPNGEGGRVPQLQLNAPAGVVLFTGTGVALGSFVAGNPNALALGNGDDEFGYTVNDINGNALAYTLATHHAPEPASLVLMSIGLAGLTLIRRRAA